MSTRDQDSPVFLLSIVMPAYNEEASVAQVVHNILALKIPGGIDLIVVNDGSKDSTGELLAELDSAHPFTIIHHPKNRGKGAAVRTGIAAARGTHLLVFDADTEYNPLDIPVLAMPIVTNRAEVVYGARVRGHHTLMPTMIHAMGNKIMTSAANILFHSAISDLHTCLKLIPLPLLRSLKLDEQGFGLDTEITAELLRHGFRPYEISVSYVGRSKEEGKKIKSSDALRCFYVLLKVRVRGVTRPGLRDKTLAPRVRTPKDE